MFRRRGLVVATLLSLAGPTGRVAAQQRRSLADPLRVGADPALMDSGLAPALQRAFGRDTGVAVRLVRMASLPLLEALDRGEFDAALTNEPLTEEKLDKQGLVHDRRAIAAGSFLMVGPAPARRERSRAAPPSTPAVDVLAAFTAVRDAHLATPGSVMFLSAADGCGAHARELALWRQAGIAPQPPWYGSVARGARLIENARARGAYALVERGEWLASGGAPLAVLADGGPLLAEQVHVMRAFRVNHPAGKMFVAWIAGTRGGNVVSGHRGYARVTA